MEIISRTKINLNWTKL